MYNFPISEFLSMSWPVLRHVAKRCHASVVSSSMLGSNASIALDTDPLWWFHSVSNRAYWAKWWSLLDSACPNYPRKVVLYPVTKFYIYFFRARSQCTMLSSKNCLTFVVQISLNLITFHLFVTVSYSIMGTHVGWNFIQNCYVTIT